MLSVIKFFWGLCIMRQGPEQAPSYPAFLLIVGVLYFLFSIVLRITMLDMDLLSAVMRSLIVLAVVSLVIWSALLFKQMKNRFRQTLSSVLAEDFFLALLTFPYLYSVAQSGVQGTMLLLLFFYGWDLAAKGFILRRALNLGPMLGLFLALVMMMLAAYAETFWPMSTPEIELTDHR